MRGDRCLGKPSAVAPEIGGIRLGRRHDGISAMKCNQIAWSRCTPGDTTDRRDDEKRTRPRTAKIGVGVAMGIGRQCLRRMERPFTIRTNGGGDRLCGPICMNTQVMSGVVIGNAPAAGQSDGSCNGK